MTPGDFRLVITSGPTREWLDPVRFLSNASSGRTGWCLASAGLPLFRQVTLISGPVAREYCELAGAEITLVDTTQDMADAVRAAAGPATLLIMAAAPADYTPAHVSDAKLKKTPGSMELKLRPTVDILGSIAALGDSFPSFYRVGFAAETGDLESNARDKLRRKRLNFICGNEVFRTARGFGENSNTWSVYGMDGSTKTIGPGDKAQLSRQLLAYLIESLP